MGCCGRFVEDGSTYWLPAVEVRHWLQEMHLHGRTFASRTVGAASDDFAARVLTDLRSSSIQNSGTVSCESLPEALVTLLFRGGAIVLRPL